MSESAREYLERIQAHRLGRDQFMAAHPRSPLPVGAREGFRGLAYFPPDETWRIRARVTRLDHPEELMLTSTGAQRRTRRVAQLDFVAAGRACRLIGFASSGGGLRLFVPFADATTGRETYGGGRYLDVLASGREVTELDFNLAYHPYCVYADRFSCPRPPADNRLAIAVAAGERLAGDAHAAA